MTLALLLTAVGGAWAEEKTINWTIGNGDDSGWGGSVTQNGIKIQCNSDDAKVDNGSNPCFFECYESSEYVTFTISMEDGSDILGVNMTLAENGDAFQNLDGWTGSGDTRTWTGKAKSVDLRVNRKGYYDEFENWQNQYLRVSALSVTVDAPAIEPAIEVTTNAASEGATFTEASFEMPTSDATAEYELVRDMSVQMTTTMGDGTDGVRYRVRKAQQGGGYEPADLNMMQVLALVAVNDGIEQKALTLNQDYYCRIYKLDEQTLQPIGDGVMLFDFDFAPGLYALKAFAQNGGDYAGETALSNTFKLFQGYEVEVAAKEFITYYKDEPLYADTETSADAELYTITSVSADQATLSAAIQTAPSLTPLLIFNNSDQAKTFLLIPANEEPEVELTVAPEFKGTLAATTITASNEGTTNYALNGKAFVWVKNAIEVGPNKAWLSVNNSNARANSIVFDDATKIANTNITNITNGNWYDLNGRKLDKMPTKKGVYILNGKKVVVK